MLELEFFPKDSEIIKEGTVNTHAYIIIKGEVSLQSSINLYTLSLHA